MPATEYGDRAITELLRESNAALHDSLRVGLDVEGTLLRVRGRALVREIAAAQPAAEFPDH
jgi:RNA polymerase sigma-70 factor (ECF subfamily)